MPTSRKKDAPVRRTAGLSRPGWRVRVRSRHKPCGATHDAPWSQADGAVDHPFLFLCMHDPWRAVRCGPHGYEHSRSSLFYYHQASHFGTISGCRIARSSPCARSFAAFTSAELETFHYRTYICTQLIL
ncbi:hypothetical protein EI94DRAFT_715026 [Lactarius quietus]|nr:hypothetical protein EI94DRAFT_715026 [Lactarius quietus]